LKSRNGVSNACSGDRTQTHLDPSGFAAFAIFTAEPSMMESDGSRITASSDVNPDNTSTLLP
jgi:hypothetical protein